MQRKTHLLLIGGGFLAGILLGFAALRAFSGRNAAPAQDASPAAREQVSPLVGSLAPDFSLPTLEGDSEIRLSDLRGLPVVLNFWASWCGPCRLEMPDIQERARRWEGQLVVLGVNYDEPRSDAQAFVDETGVTFPIVMDRGKRISREYQVQGLPTTVILDADGVVRVRHVGLMTGSQLDQYLEQVGLTP